MHGPSRQAGKPLGFIRRTPSQRCRDGLSGFPEGTPEVMEWNDYLLLSFQLSAISDQLQNGTSSKADG
jgi:hypothetical protein